MENLLKEYWSQIAVLIAAVGYLCKVFLDYSFKRKEIGYSIYAKERLNAITNFLSSYEKVQLEIRVAVGQVNSMVRRANRPYADTSSIPSMMDELRNNMRHSRLFLSSKEFDLFHDLTADLDLVYGELQMAESKLKSYKLSILDAADKWQSECESTLHKNEFLLETFIDNLRKKYSRRS
jgi:hypothetical protein